jgi:2-polyprenyl-3-methyl-5-hydroxy-6-metoxy-1,4-benzoquinol methylase
MLSQPMRQPSAAERNLAIYNTFWEEAPDFVRYNPGARHRRRLILQQLSTCRIASALDVGCGNGELLASLARAHPEISTLAGADLSPEQVARNERRFPGVDFYSLNIQTAPLERTFDVVICSEVIEHLDDQRAAIGHLASMLNDGGKLLITCPTGQLFATERHFGHVHHPTPQELEAFAAAAGLRVVSMLNWGWPTYRMLKWATNVNSDWALRNFASGKYSYPAKAVSDCLYWVSYLNRSHDDRGCQLIGVFEKSVSR